MTAPDRAPTVRSVVLAESWKTLGRRLDWDLVPSPVARAAPILDSQEENMHRRDAFATAGAITAVAAAAMIGFGTNVGLFGLTSANTGAGAFPLVAETQPTTTPTSVADVPVVDPPVATPAPAPASGSTRTRLAQPASGSTRSQAAPTASVPAASAPAASAPAPPASAPAASAPAPKTSAPPASPPSGDTPAPRPPTGGGEGPDD